MTTDNFCFYWQNRLIQTSQKGGQLYSDTSPFSTPWSEPPTNFTWQEKAWVKFSTLEMSSVMHALTMQYLPKRPNLKLKTQPKQLLGSLPLYIALSVGTHLEIIVPRVGGRPLDNLLREGRAGQGQREEGQANEKGWNSSGKHFQNWKTKLKYIIQWWLSRNLIYIECSWGVSSHFGC